MPYALLWLQGLGKKTLLLEASDKDKRKVCGEYLCPAGVDLLKQLNLDSSLKHARTIEGMHLFTLNNTQIDCPFLFNRHGKAVRRDVFDQHLRDYALDAGVTLIRGVRVDHIEHSDEHWHINSGAQQWRSLFLIGADGRQSYVSKHLGVHKAHSSKRIAIHAHCNGGRGTSFGEMHLLPGGRYIGVNPTGDHEWNVSLVCEADQIENDATATLAKAMADSPNLRNRFELPSLVQVVSPITHLVGQVAGQNWALIGDAGGFLDPLTGEGMYQALVSAKQIAELIQIQKASYRDLSGYNYIHRKTWSDKSKVNRFFQWVIRKSSFVSFIENFLTRHPQRPSIFISMVANIIKPRQGLNLLLKTILQRKVSL